MSKISELLHPLLTRWRTRNRCFCCGGPVVKRCLTHGTKLCGSAFCRMEHRRYRSAIRGSLLRPFCDIREKTEWIDYLIRSVAVVVVGTFFAWMIVWL